PPAISFVALDMMRCDGARPAAHARVSQDAKALAGPSMSQTCVTTAASELIDVNPAAERPIHRVLVLDLN
ncbi:MAG: hypothetical protein ACRCS9_10310, partial [Hyphomicrobium sp.]